MLNPDFRLAAGATHGTLGVVWTAHADDAVSFVYVNGRLEAEAFAPGRAERSIDVPWHGGDARPPGTARTVEIHDFDPADVPAEIQPAITVPPPAFTLPVLHFTAVADAARYRIYHRPEGGVELRLAEIDADAPAGALVTFPCVDVLDGAALAGRWHFFRIESVSAYGVESRRESWVWRAMDVAPPPAVTVKPGAVPGRYDFHV